MQFVKLTRDNGQPIWISASAINDIQSHPNPESGCKSYIQSLHPDLCYAVREAPEEVLELLSSGDKWIQDKIYRNTPDSKALSTARFPPDGGTPSTFKFKGHRWRYAHTSFDDDGEFDVIERPRPTEAGAA